MRLLLLTFYSTKKVLKANWQVLLETPTNTNNTYKKENIYGSQVSSLHDGVMDVVTLWLQDTCNEMSGHYC